ncbi:MAG: beta-propeller fold lactonase family protein [Acidobacteriales bacterium]|nr:beta-propeller fold lactonase family protein [Terriglobales bacterium]
MCQLFKSVRRIHRSHPAPLQTSRAVSLKLAAFLAVVCFAATGFAQLDLLYINANIGSCPKCQTSSNQVLAYNLHTTTGILSRINGPFTTGGTGVYRNPPGNEIDADQQVIVNAAGTLLFAVDGDSNDIAVFSINSDGSLTAAPGSPFPSNGPQPASLGLLEDPAIGGGNSILVVANKDNDPLQPPTTPNFSTFLVSPTGVLTLNSGATITLQSGASPTQALINQKGDLLFGMEYYGSNGHANLTSYRIKLDGTLSAVSTVNPPNGGKYFLGEAQNPQTSALYAGLPDQSSLGVYQFGIATGTIAYKATVADPAKPGWLTINRRGTRLYASENAANAVTVYQTSNSLKPVQLQHLVLSSGGTFGATNLALDGTEKYLFVLTGTTLHTLSVLSDGTLAETIPAHLLPVPAGTIPTGMSTLVK